MYPSVAPVELVGPLRALLESLGNDEWPVRCYAEGTGAIGFLPGCSAWQGNRGESGIWVRLSAALRIPHGLTLAPDAQRFYDPHILAGAFPAQIAQEPTAPTDHLEKTATGREVLPVGLQVFRKFGNAMRESRNLYLRGTDILSVGSVGLYEILLRLSCE